MRTRTTTAAAVLLTAVLTGCSGSGAEPAESTVSAPTSIGPSLDKAQVTQACVDAVAEIARQSAGEVPSEPTPAPCAPLSDSEYLKAYMDGIFAANRDVLDERQRQRDEEAEKDATPN
jgi:hypothetical protein